MRAGTRRRPWVVKSGPLTCLVGLEVESPVCNGPHFATNPEIPLLVLSHDELTRAASKPALRDLDRKPRISQLMLQQVRRCRSSRTPRCHIFHLSEVVPGACFSRRGVKNQNELCTRGAEQSFEIVSADPSPRHGFGRDRNDEVGQPCSARRAGASLPPPVHAEPE